MRILWGAAQRAYEQVLVDAAAARAERDANLREIARLDARICELQTRWAYERERADKATDALLAVSGKPSILPDAPPPPSLDDPYEHEDPSKVDAILRDMGIGGTK